MAIKLRVILLKFDKLVTSQSMLAGNAFLGHFCIELGRISSDLQQRFERQMQAINQILMISLNDYNMIYELQKGN